MTNLVRCSTCKRHIYASESACPFCAKSSVTTAGNVAVALTAAASIALAGCANDPPKKDPGTEVAPDARKTEASQAAPNPTPPPVAPPNPTPVATAPEPAPSATVQQTPTKPLPTTTTTQAVPTTRTAPAYGLPPPTTTVPIQKKPPAAAYGAPPRPPGGGDPL